MKDDGSLLCTISKGWSLNEVANACGAPTKSGDQPKVAQGWTTFCSAPCELRGRSLVFYDCERGVASVEAATTDWHGCALHWDRTASAGTRRLPRTTPLE